MRRSQLAVKHKSTQVWLSPLTVQEIVRLKRVLKSALDSNGGDFELELDGVVYQCVLLSKAKA